MHLTEEPEIVQWPASHYLFVEKNGSISKNAPQAWQEFHSHLAGILRDQQVSGFVSLYRPNEGLYRAGVMVNAQPSCVPQGLSYELFQGGKYGRFIMTGPYSSLPEACSRVFELVQQAKPRLRDDFYLEHYVNDPRTTPEDQLITAILVPLA